MTLTLSDEQLAEIKRGGTISVRSPDDQQLVICSQSEYVDEIVSVVQDIRSRLGDRLTADELREEIEDALEKRAWSELGRKALNAWAKDNPY
jgi:hypothetical protein